MNITGAHVIVYSKNADADREFIRDILQFPHVDVGHGWLIFALPPAELATHLGERNDMHELYLMCDDVHEFIAHMDELGIATTPLQEERWGSRTKVTLPGGGALGMYQPKHPSPTWSSGKAGKSAKKKSAPKKAPPKKSSAKKSATKSKSPATKSKPAKRKR